MERKPDRGLVLYGRLGFIEHVSHAKAELAHGGGTVVFKSLNVLARSGLEADARRENSPPGGVITLSKSLLHIRQQNYKNEGRGKNPSPCFHALRRCLVKAGSHVAARSSCGTARGLSPPARRETA